MKRKSILLVQADISLSTNIKVQGVLNSSSSVRQDSEQTNSNRRSAECSIVECGNLFSRTDSAFQIVQEMDEFTDLTHFSKWMERARNYQVISHAFRDNHQDAIGYCSECLKINKQGESQHRIVGILNNIGALDEEIREIEKTEGRKNIIPIIAMTASLLKSEINNCYDAGMNNYVPKPYNAEELIGPIYEEINQQPNKLN